MQHKLHFKLGNEKFFINYKKKTLLIVDIKKFTREFYYLDDIQVGEDWIIMETSLSKVDELIWDFENINIKFKQKRRKK